MHVAHKLLLSEAILRTSDKITVGVTEENMTHSKTTKYNSLKFTTLSSLGKVLWELIEDVDTRINNVRSFVMDICPEVSYNICKIADPFGPAIVDSTMDMIIVSEETVRGGEKINESI